MAKKLLFFHYLLRVIWLNSVGLPIRKGFCVCVCERERERERERVRERWRVWQKAGFF